MDNQKALTDLFSKLDKKYGKGSLNMGETIVETPRLSTGSLGLDIITGGGWGKGRIVEIYAPESAGKAQPLTSDILTPNGWKKMGDMEVGTIISTPDGEESTVIGIFPQGEQDVYKVTFDDKTYAHCTLDHLWSVKTRCSDLHEVLSLAQILKKGLKNDRGVRKFFIPTTKAINFNNHNSLPINPYLLGLLLGDGGLTSGNVIITTADEEILESINNIILSDYDNLTLSAKRGKYDYRFKKIKNGHSKHELHLQLELLGLMGKYAYDKHIPDIYLRASIDQRIELLRGLMDSDGSSDKNSLSYTTTSLQLSKDFQDLVRGLGMRCVTSTRQTKFTNSVGQKVEGRVSYRSSILLASLHFNPFKLKRKADLIQTNTFSTYSKRFIESVEFVGRELVQCIAVGHPDRLYITNDYIVTHNTTVCIHTMVSAQKNEPDKRVGFIDAEHAFDRKYAENLGLDMSQILISQPDSGEQGLEILEALIDSNLMSVVVVDSVAALVPQSELDGDMGDSKMGLHARLMSQALRKLAGKINKSGTVVIFTNQLRDKIGVMFGNPETTTGGNALKFYASTRLDLRRKKGAADKESNMVLHNRVTAKTIKNKIAPPYQETQFDIVFGEGINHHSEVLFYAEALEIIKKSGSWYNYGDVKLGQGESNVINFLSDNPELSAEIESKIRQQYGI